MGPARAARPVQLHVASRWLSHGPGCGAGWARRQASARREGSLAARGGLTAGRCRRGGFSRGPFVIVVALFEDLPLSAS